MVAILTITIVLALVSWRLGTARFLVRMGKTADFRISTVAGDFWVDLAVAIGICIRNKVIPPAGVLLQPFFVGLFFVLVAIHAFGA